MRRVYIEMSVWGMVAPGQSPALQEPTVEFLDQCAARKAEAFNAIAVLSGLRGRLEIHTPLEVLEWT